MMKGAVMIMDIHVDIKMTGINVPVIFRSFE